MRISSFSKGVLRVGWCASRAGGIREVAGMTPHERVLAALELREPDRVPTMDMMVETANIAEILGKKPDR